MEVIDKLIDQEIRIERESVISNVLLVRSLKSTERRKRKQKNHMRK